MKKEGSEEDVRGGQEGHEKGDPGVLTPILPPNFATFILNWPVKSMWLCDDCLTSDDEAKFPKLRCK